MTKSLTRKALTLSASAATISGLTVTQHLKRRHWAIKRRHWEMREIKRRHVVLWANSGDQIQDRTLHRTKRERKETWVQLILNVQ